MNTLSPHFQEQVLQVFENIKHALYEVNVNLTDIAILRILIVNHDVQKHQFLINYMKILWNNKPFPVCTLIPVSLLALPNMLIEIEATAYCTN